MRHVLLLLCLSLAGCYTQLVDHLVEATILGPDHGRLMFALNAYRDGAGRWPASPAELENSRYSGADLHLNRYENLTFKSLADGRLAVYYDNYAEVMPDGTVIHSKGHVELSPEAGHPGKG